MDIKDFLESLPSKVNPAAIEGMSSVFHFDIEGAGQYTVSLVEGKLDVAQGLNGTSTCAVKSSAETLIGLVKKDVNPMMAMMTGKLKISNPSEILKYAKIFGLG